MLSWYVVFTSRLHCGCFAALLTWAAVSLQGSIPAGDAALVSAGPVANPHGDPSQCVACHPSTEPNGPSLRFGGDTLVLCQSCHDGRLATHQAHPAGIVPSDATAQRMTASFPLAQGILTCLSCHDVREQCRNENKSNPICSLFLRGSVDAGHLAYCLQCHDGKSYRPYNVHDQLEAGKLKTNACVWCHADVPAGGAPVQEGTSYPLRSNVSLICRNCHAMAQSHPTGKPHLYVILPEEMKWHISAYEIGPRMHLPTKQLTAYVRAARREPRSIPLDEQGRVTCATCHNPHEEGLLSKGSDRSVGAEPKQASNHRLRAPKGQVCLACHDR